MEARVGYDLDYLRHWNPSLDLRILFQTIRQMFGDKAAY
jgi:lipopolysaccharide/colanic/teichoic acid biosynthesis glycosyltransferase